MIKRTTELRRQIDELGERIAHLIEEARAVEARPVDEKERQDGERNPVGFELARKSQPSAAVGYWREIREQEVRLDAKRAELRSLQEGGEGGSVWQVFIRHDGPSQ